MDDELREWLREIDERLSRLEGVVEKCCRNGRSNDIIMWIILIWLGIISVLLGVRPVAP